MYYLVDNKKGKTDENVDPKTVQFKYINLLIRNRYYIRNIMRNDYKTSQNIIDKHLDIRILILILTGRHNWKCT